jgi:DNA-binding LacI/PurR family transcriptional regulator
MRSATSRDVAGRAGEFVATISPVPNGSAPVADDTCRRVPDATRPLGAW